MRVPGAAMALPARRIVSVMPAVVLGLIAAPQMVAEGVPTIQEAIKATLVDTTPLMVRLSSISYRPPFRYAIGMVSADFEFDISMVLP